MLPTVLVLSVSALKNWQPPRCSECEAVLTQSAAGTKCRSCLDQDRVKCISCGSDIYGLYKQCLYCHRSKVFGTMQEELKKRGREGGDFAALCRQEAWHREREAKRTDDEDRKLALMDLAAEMRGWSDEDDKDALAGSEPVPVIDRQGVER